MLNRRHLRIKVLQILYAFFQSKSDNIIKAENELMTSVDRIYDMYLLLLLTFSEINRAAQSKLTDRKKKLLPNAEDLNPNLKFVQNPFFQILENSNELSAVSSKRKVNWMGADNQVMFRKMFSEILESEVYVLYMNDSDIDFESERNFMIQLFRDQIANSEWLQNYFDEQSIYWSDDLDLCCGMVLKTLKNTEAMQKEIQLLPLHKDEADETKFIKDLLRMSIIHNEEIEQIIEDLADNWELERIAKMDVLLLKMGLAELMYFPSIPTKVTINEYIDISKYYSTPKSNIFINGILDKAVVRLTAEQRIVKSGRGLIS